MKQQYRLESICDEILRSLHLRSHMVDLQGNVFDDFRFQFFEIRPEGRGKSYSTKREKYATLAGNTRARIFLEFSRRRNIDLFHFAIFAWTSSVAWNFATRAR